MRYFDDITFIDGGVLPRYGIHLDRAYDAMSIELCSDGGMYHQRDLLPRVEMARGLFWHRPGCRYHYGPTPRPGWWYHHWVMFRGPRAERILANALDPLSPGHALPLANVDELHRLFIELVGLVQGVRRRHGEAVAVLERIVAAVGTAAAPPGVQSVPVEAVADAVAARPFLAWDWAREARRLGMSEAHFRRVFRAVTGAPPARHLLTQRMRMVGRRLLDDPRAVHLVAAECGFRDQAAFTRRFARVLGTTPRRWRAMHAGV